MLNLHFTSQTFSFITLFNEFQLVVLASYGW